MGEFGVSYRMNNIKKSFIIIVMSICFIFSGCKSKDGIFISTGLKNDEMFKIGGSVCTVKEAELFLYTVRNQYEAVYGKDIWNVHVNGDKQTMQEYVKDVVKQQLARTKCMYLLAKNKGIELEASEEQQIELAANEYYESLTSEEKEGLLMDVESVKEMYREYLYAEKIYEELTGSVNVEISDDDARVITIQYIRIEKNEQNADEKHADISTIETQIKDGGDFAALAVEHSDDDVYEKTVKRGDMPTQVDEVIFELVNDEVSGIVETTDSYYLTKCISDYNKDETAKNKVDLLINAKEEAFNTEYDSYINTLPSEFNDDVWNAIDFTKESVGTSTNFFDVYNAHFTR